jgi:hypothetical protein
VGSIAEGYKIDIQKLMTAAAEDDVNAVALLHLPRIRMSIPVLFRSFNIFLIVMLV